MVEPEHTRGELLPRDGGIVWYTGPDNKRVKVPDFIDIDGTEVTLEVGVQVGPGVKLSGKSHVRAGAELGNNVEIIDSEIGASRIGDGSTVTHATVKDNSQVGENNTLEPGSVVESEVVTGHTVIVGENYTVASGEMIEPETELVL